MKSSLLKSTGIVAFSTLLSRIMGFVRDLVIANFFGASPSLDGFLVAFRIPNLFRRLVAEGSLTISFVPVYTEYLVNKGEKEALELAQKTLSILLLVLASIVVIGEIFSPELVRLFGYGFTDPEIISLTVSLNRVMFPYLFLVGLVAFSMGFLNSHKSFFAPAFAPVFLNVGFITGAFFLKNFFNNPLYGLALGVLMGGVMQVILQIPYMIKNGFRLKISLDFNHPGIRSIFRMITPALLGIAIYQINMLMSTILASMLPSGSIAYLYYSDRLTEMTLGIFIISIGNVILPELSGFSASNDFRKINKLYTSSINAALFISIPASAALITIGLPIISVLLMRGEFTPYHADMTYRALLFASMGIASISIVRITVPAFYSLKDTKIPALAAGVSFVLNITLGYILMQTALKHAGLTLANAISATAQMLILLLFLQRKIGSIGVKSLLLAILKMALSGLAMAAVIWYISGFVDWLNDQFFKRLSFLIIIILAGGSTYLLFCSITGVNEIRYLKDRISRRRRRLN